MSRRELAVILAILALLLAFALWPEPARSDVPVTSGPIPASAFVPVRTAGMSGTTATPAVHQPRTPSPAPPSSPAASVQPAPFPPAPSLRAVQRLAAVRVLDAASTTGYASWYAYVPGGAAAGPALRAALGAGWRGVEVAVCRTDGGAMACVRVTLSDWCACADRNGVPTVIDLDSRAFAALMPLSRGLVTVEVLTP